LLQELRKKAELDEKNCSGAGDFIESIEEIVSVVEMKQEWLECCFGTSQYHEVMVALSESSVDELRRMILKNQAKDKYYQKKAKEEGKIEAKKTESLTVTTKKVSRERQPSGRKGARNQWTLKGSYNKKSDTLNQKFSSGHSTYRHQNQNLDLDDLKVKLDFQSVAS